MTLHMNLDGISVRLKIWNYRPSPDGDWTADWCKTDVLFSSEPWLNYRLEEDEVFLSCELEELYEGLGRLLSGELHERKEVEMMEPDFAFILYPRRDLRDDPRVTHVRSGYEILDISVDWTVAFWHDGLTNNYLTVELKRKDIGNLRTYLGLVMGVISQDDPLVAELLEEGILIN